MKKIIIVLIVLISTLNSKSQMVVNDPVVAKQQLAQNLLLKKDMAETIRQSRVLAESYKTAKEGVAIFTKVSSALKNVGIVHSILNNQINIVKKSAEISKNIPKLNLKSANIVRANKQMNALIKEGDGTVKLLKTLMKDGALNSNDGQRLLIIIELQKKQETTLSRLNSLKRELTQKSRQNDRIDALKKRRAKLNRG